MTDQKCPRCTAIIPKGEFICPECGIDIRDWNPDKLRCPVCRALYPQGTKFCLKDGSPLEPAVVNFDTEATMFLAGSFPSSSKEKEKKEDLIPRMKFADDNDRVIPKLERDGSGHIAPPPPPPPKPDVILPDKWDPSSTKKEEKKPTPSSGVSPLDSFELEQESPLSPSPPSALDKPAIKSPGKAPVIPPQPKPAHRIKTLEEYERLIKEEEEREARQMKEKSLEEALRTQIREKKHRGFFHRLVAALKVLIGK